MSFITGSRAYGTPTIKSDIDLVVRVSEETAHALRELGDGFKLSNKEVIPCKFGRLNLILCTTDEQYAVWRIGTTQMQLQRGTSKKHGFNRDQAKGVLDTLRVLVGLYDQADSERK